MRSKFDFPSNLIKLVVGASSARAPLSVTASFVFRECLVFCEEGGHWPGLGRDQDDGHLHNSRRWGTGDMARAANTEGKLS